MAIVIDDAQMEDLAQRLASAEGVSITEVIRESLLSLANRRGIVQSQAPLRERLAALAREVDAVPPSGRADHRSDNEVLGYNDHGTW